MGSAELVEIAITPGVGTLAIVNTAGPPTAPIGPVPHNAGDLSCTLHWASRLGYNPFCPNTRFVHILRCPPARLVLPRHSGAG